MQVDLKVPTPIMIEVVSGPPRDEPEPNAGDFFDHLLDMNLSPDQVELRTIHNGWRGSVRDAQHIRNYFRESLSEMPSE